MEPEGFFLCQTSLSRTEQFASGPNPLFSPYFCILILSPNTRLGLFSCLFPAGLSPRIFCGWLISPKRATCTAYFICLAGSQIYIKSGKSSILKLLFMHFSPSLRYFLPLMFRYSPQHPVLKHTSSLPPKAYRPATSQTTFIYRH